MLYFPVRKIWGRTLYVLNHRVRKNPLHLDFGRKPGSFCGGVCFCNGRKQITESWETLCVGNSLKAIGLKKCGGFRQN